MSRGYEDAYHQFIEPVVGASGERVGQRLRSQNQSEVRSQLIEAKPEPTELIHAGDRPIGSAVRRRSADDADLRDDDVRVRQRGRRWSPTTRGDRRSISTRATAIRRWSASSRQLAALDRAEAALLFSSGMAATATILMAHAEGGRRGRLQRRDLRRHAAPAARSARAVRRHAAVRVARGAGGARVGASAIARGWSGSSRRSTRRCAAWTSRRVAAACRARGVLSVIDNTFASPINQQPLALGVDLAMQSATKYLNGHSDVTGGVVTGAATAARADREGAAACSAR